LPVPVQNPSNTVISDVPSLTKNFAENAVNVVCQAALGAGTYALASRILGAPVPKPPQALLVSGALLAAMTLCPSRPTQEGIFGYPSGFSGGQCAVPYNVRFRFSFSDAGGGVAQDFDFTRNGVMGPIRLKQLPPDGPTATQMPNSRLQFINGSGGLIVDALSDFGLIPDSLIVNAVRVDGLPDNCGNQNNVGGNLVRDVINGDTINSNNVTNNSNEIYIAPVKIAFGNVRGTVNLPFSNIRIGSLLPLNFSIEIGGVRYGFRQKPDGGYEPVEVDPDRDSPSRTERDLEEVKKVLDSIKDCVCSPSGELEKFSVPFAVSNPDCEIVSQELLIPRDSAPFDLSAKLVASASAALANCNSASPPQLPESLIYAASTTVDGRELFTPDIAPEVISLRVKITDIRDDGPEKLTLFPAANQRKFGSVGFSILPISGGGEPIYVYDQDTYIPLPKRRKKGRLRILFKRGLSFEVYDNGER
jgi:hypothetical protein